MMDSPTGIWRFAQSVRPAERRRVLFFAGVASLVTLGQTLGLAGAEALFLTRYGVQYLPQTFIFASGTTILGMLLYAGLVGSTRNDKMFSNMLWLASVPLGFGAYAASTGAELVLPGLLAGYFLTQAIFLSHFWTFASDYFDTIATKRLSHLFTFAASLGGAVGGAATAGISSLLPPEALIAAWAGVLVVTGLVIRLGRRGLIRWGLLELVEKDETSLEGLASAVRFARTSPLGHWLVGSAAAMTLALFVSQYLYSEIFVATFPDTSELAIFLGTFLMLSNLGEIAISFWVTPWLTRRLGVGRANLVHPVFTALSYIALALDPRLYAAVLARVNREVLDDAMSATIRHLTYNAISQRLRGRMRALVEGIVVYSMMGLAGGLILLEVDPFWLCGFGGFMALVYLLANLRVRDEYLYTLVGGIREGRVDVAHLSEHLSSWEAPRLTELWDTLAVPGSAQSAISAARLAPILAASGVYEPLERAASEGEPRVRRACVEALAQCPDGIPEPVLLAALADSDSGVRRAAVRSLAAGEEEDASPPSTSLARQRVGGGEMPYGSATGPADDRRSFDRQLLELMEDESPEVRAEAAAALGNRGFELLSRMAASSDPREAVAALERLPSDLASKALACADSSDSEVRAAALEAIARLSSFVSIGRDRLARDLNHPSAEVRAAATMALAATAAASAESFQAAATALGDSSRKVRKRAVEALRAAGEIGRTSAIPYLRAYARGTAEAAIEVLSNPTSPEARKLLIAELRVRVRQAWGDMLALSSLSKSRDLSTRFLRAAHEDSMVRNQAIAFALLRGLEEPAVVRSVERALLLGGPRTRSNALEVLSNLGNRVSANLMVLMLEDSTTEEKAESLDAVSGSPEDLDRAVDADRRAFDIWIRMGENYFRKNGDGDVSQGDTMERLLLLREIPLFARLTLDQLEAINLQMNESHYLRGEVVVREGEPGGELFLLLDGQVRAVTGYGTPEEVLLNVQDAPNYFGEMAILDHGPRSATVVVSYEARLLSLSGESFKDLMIQMPEIAFEICSSLSTRVRGLERGQRSGDDSIPSLSVPG